MSKEIRIPCRRFHILLTSLSALVVCLFLGSLPVAAKIVTITDIPGGLPEDLAYGRIIREIRVEGNDYTREEVIRLALKSQVGQAYTQDSATLDLLWVLRLGSFTSVTFATLTVPDGVVLVVKVAEATPYIPSLSLALTQENGLEIGPAFSSSNLLGTAARASAYARFGGATNFGFRYADPQLPGSSLLIGYRIEYFHRERTNKLLDFEEKTDEVLFEYKQVTNESMRTGLRFRYLGLKSDRDNITLGTENSDVVPSLGIFAQHDSRNSVYPTGGWFLDLEVGKYGIFGGDSDYWRLDLDVRRYLPFPLLGDRHSLAITSYAALVSGELGVTIPHHQEFQIGGTNSVRGWSLGSRQGQNQWLTTVEYWFRLMDQKAWDFWFIKWRMGLQIGVFGDVGTAWTGYEGLEQNMIGGGGAGFRLTLPVVTMVRFDVSVGEDSFGMRFFIGGGEKAEAQKQRVR